MSKNVATGATRCVAQELEEEVVISGIAGRFPESDNVRMLETNLFNKIDLITDDDRRWTTDHKDVPHRTGKINNLSKFDALFFGVSAQQADVMDPIGRMLMEHCYEAIVDAGVNPKYLRGTQTAVIAGCSFSEAERSLIYEKPEARGLGLTGCCRAMLSNRIAYWLGVHGPSYTIDTACSTGLVAIEQALRLIRSGRCDQAVVATGNLCLHPTISLQFARLGVLGFDGHCRAFDADAGGYARSESICAVFLQKAKSARRIYATIVNGMTNTDGYKEQGITFPSSKLQSDLFKECYEECGLSPTILSYLEAHGTGTKVGDPEEINAIDNIFCKGRTTPLKIGSVKSNLGHTEPSSGICSIAKVIIAMETGLIPPNLHFTRPREGMVGIEEGRLEVVTEATPWKGGYAGVNAFGFGGVNCHILLKHNTKEKINNGAPKDNLPRLVVVSGRTKEAVSTILDDVQNRAVDVEYVKLLHDIYVDEIQNHLYRGYTIVGKTKSSQGPIATYSGLKRPVWFVFSGMGSQWPGMGEALMKFPVYARTIEKCHCALKPYGIDLYHILTAKDKKMFDNILNSFLGIAAVQIALIDLLTYVGIVPDNVIGHSVGELGCAYADGCFTAEQTILAAYFRGLASKEAQLIQGSMAAIGRGYNQIKNICPPDIDIACHNSAESCTISGPANSVKTFVAHLQENGVFAKEVPTSNIAYHSRYIMPVGSKLLTYLKRVIPHPKARSAKWISSSVPQSEWSGPVAKFSSAEYHTNNLLSSVLFEESAALIPADAIAIEIAPHGLLQAILKRSMPSTVTNLSLTLRDHEDNAEVFLHGLGKLYNAGLQLQLAKLYPEVQYPVSRGTPMISPIIRWDHSIDWNDHLYAKRFKLGSGEREVDVTPMTDQYAYFAGHVIDGRNLMPATGYLVLIWETFGMMNEHVFTDIPVIFENVKFNRSVILRHAYGILLLITIQQGTGLFEITEDGVSIVTGRIRKMDDTAQEKISDEMLETYNYIDRDVKEDKWMTTDDIYKELKLRGYHYSGLFRGLINTSINGTKGHIAWEDNWVAFMDNILQMRILASDTRDLFVPTSIKKLIIDPMQHEKCISNTSNDRKEIAVRFYKDWDTLISGGHAYMDQAVRGDLSSIHWDVMVSTGRLAFDISAQNRRDCEGMLGLEYSGYDSKGCPVMGITPRRGFSNLVHVDKCFTWPVPEGWTLEDAATVPCVYATAYYALYLKGKMKKGDKVLIHAGSGGVGQAAIHLAFHEGCEIFTTVGTPDKRNFIKKTFPFIDDKHIGNSRNISFEQLILKETKGRGVDIVLNSLADDKLQASLRCLAPLGRFLEIGKFDLMSNNSLGMNIFLKEISFQGVMLDNLMVADSDDKIPLKNLLTSGLRSGVVKPLPRKVYKIDEAETAFRYMAAGKHIGKVLIKIHEDKAQLNTPILAQPRFYCHPGMCYIVVGGLGGFGLELADWLILRGAKHLMLVSRNGLQNGYQRARTELWKSYGTNLSIITGLNISTLADCEFLLKSAEEMAPVDGIFNVAVVLKDGICINQTPESFEQSFKPKAWATENLDRCSRKMCTKLRYFVVFSSISCGRGNAGQTNYGMSNSIMERICEKRVQEGFPGLAIQWGAIGQVGLLANLEKDDKTIVIGGTLQQDLTSCLEVLDNFFLQNIPVVSSMVVAEKNVERVDLTSIVNTVANIIGRNWTSLLETQDYTRHERLPLALCDE
ncbi:hypothetical protein KM043_017898 [Ampulex compressa]|nr:hypothetical protein KM043_017898 [Ampulex compressa]